MYDRSQHQNFDHCFTTNVHITTASKIISPSSDNYILVHNVENNYIIEFHEI